MRLCVCIEYDLVSKSPRLIWYIYIYIYMCVCVCVCMYICIYIYIYSLIASPPFNHPPTPLLVIFSKR